MLKKIDKSMLMGLFLSLTIGGMLLSLQPSGQAGQPANQVGLEQSGTVIGQSGDKVVVMEAGWGWLKRFAACAWCAGSAFLAEDACYYCAHGKKKDKDPPKVP